MTLPKNLNEININAANRDAGELKRDDNSATTSNAQTQNNHSAAQPSNVNEHIHNNDVDMSGNVTEEDKQANEVSDDKKKKSNELSDNGESSDDNSSSESEDEREEDEWTTINNNKNSNNKRSTKLPPIDVWTEHRADIQREIQNIVPSDSCLYSRINNMKFRVIPSDDKTRTMVIEYLTNKNYNFNTYTPSDSKMINVLLKGLDHINDVNVIKNELAEKGFEPYQIKKHITGYMRKNNSNSNLWLIVLQPNTDTKELFKIKAIDHAIVKFEFMRKPKVIQCRRCQRFNHSASNCRLPYRCVKCTNTHEPGQCPSTTMKNKFKPKCVNCNGNHTANDATTCDIFKKVIASKESKKQKPSKLVNKQSPLNKLSSVRSSQVKPVKVQQISKEKQIKTSDTTNIGKFIENQNKMMNDFMSTMQKMQQHFFTTFMNRNG